MIQGSFLIFGAFLVNDAPMPHFNNKNSSKTIALRCNRGKYDHLEEPVSPIPLLQSGPRGSYSSIRLVRPLLAQAVFLLKSKTRIDIFVFSMTCMNKHAHYLSKSRFVICRVKSIKCAKEISLDLQEAKTSRLSLRLLWPIQIATRS